MKKISTIRSIKCGILHVCRFLGLFGLSARFFRRRLHILCYHGFEVLDECSFRPLLFISRSTFAERLRRIEEYGMNVLPLEQAIQELRDGTMPERAVVITIDDGFASTSSIAVPLLQKSRMPATVYLTTYYSERNVPIFRLAVQYLFWRAGVSVVTAAKLDLDDRGSTDESLSVETVVKHGEALDTEDKRQTLLVRLAGALGVDTRTLYDNRLLSLMSGDEVRAIAAQGIDVQLHTHRHRFPRHDKAAACTEIEENRARLEALTGRSARHFCYPSGEFASTQWPWLESLGIKSATTCLPGSNAPETPPYGLRRFLDSEGVRPIEFDAELAGFGELIRVFKSAVSLGTAGRSDAYESQTASR